jgi:cyclase
MLKKRIIFILYYGDSNFYLSRNFRLQKVGDYNWLKNNYDFSKISFYIDELAVINVSKAPCYEDNFCATLKELAKKCFVPIAAGGGIRTFEFSKKLLMSGADKIILNSVLFENLPFVEEVCGVFGQQCVVGQLDIKKNENLGYAIYTNSGTKLIENGFQKVVKFDTAGLVGEWIVNSIDRDGTGQGFDFDILNLLSKDISSPIIISGGAGNASHLVNGLKNSRVDAVATAHLYNFIGDGLSNARKIILNSGIRLASWPKIDIDFLTA